MYKLNYNINELDPQHQERMWRFQKSLNSSITDEEIRHFKALIEHLIVIDKIEKREFELIYFKK